MTKNCMKKSMFIQPDQGRTLDHLGQARGPVRWLRTQPGRRLVNAPRRALHGTESRGACTIHTSAAAPAPPCPLAPAKCALNTPSGGMGCVTSSGQSPNCWKPQWSLGVSSQTQAGSLSPPSITMTTNYATLYQMVHFMENSIWKWFIRYYGWLTLLSNWNPWVLFNASKSFWLKNVVFPSSAVADGKIFCINHHRSKPGAWRATKTVHRERSLR